MIADQTPWHFLINPAAGRGKALRRWEKWLPALSTALPQMTVEESTSSTNLSELAEAAVRAGKTHLVGVGGDGTHHGILNGIVRAEGLRKVVYVPLPLGTGNDWVRTLKTPRTIGPWLEMVRRQKVLEHNIGQLTYLLPALPPADPERRTTWFLNVAGMAYDAEVVRRSEKARWKSQWLYPLLTLLYLKGFVPPTVKIEYDEQTLTLPVHTINIGIGRYSGGGMRLVPHADPAAATLALTVAHQLPIWKIIISSWRFYTGSIGELKEVTTTHVKSVKITPVAGKTMLEADGELLGELPLTASMLDDRLQVLVP
ncbi:hypothetical protein FUA23_17005 [Neolewinella aurantiaca]|uniref:DAGKc domain-containing protein n=1 Tax=Neolewinella aurantiaca TaxID=2602767 RepID=A0A5C7FED4_9BACT|nr:diacylglycerol kinase family protein [Neolewinella aurantiaca]TXF87858.1 hypothetical protein FUA23_17005 [Neolewinella aurantiaca]